MLTTQVPSIINVEVNRKSIKPIGMLEFLTNPALSILPKFKLSVKGN